MSPQRDRATLLSEAGPPDDSFRAAVGAYVGAILASVATVAAVALGASTATIVGTFPTAGMVGVHAGILASGPVDGLPLRIAGSRWAKAALWVPAVAFAGLAASGLVVPAIDAGTAFAAILGVALTGATAFALTLSARTRRVNALTGDDPTATGSFYPSFRYRDVRLAFPYVGGIMVLAILAVGFLRGESAFFLLYLPALLWLFAASDDFGDPEQLGDVEVHDAGLRVERSEFPSLVRWDEIRGVRRTEDELVIERRWVDLRCPLEELDDSDGLEAAIRERVDGEAPDTEPRSEERGDDRTPDADRETATEPRR